MKLTMVAVVCALLCGCTSAPAPTADKPAVIPPEKTAVPPVTAENQAEPTHGKHHHKHHRGNTGNVNESAPSVKATAKATAGNFDFYVLSLSWAPGFCATPAGKNDPQECGPERHYAFVLHGLWPQYEAKGYPENCSGATVDNATVQSMLSIMPSPGLVKHEWSTHGTCSGLSAKEYFEEATDAYEEVKVPAAYQHLSKMLTVSPLKIQEDLVAANPSFGPQGFSVLCSGKYLQEVHACMTKDLAGRACNREVQQEMCKLDQVILRPVR